MSRRSRVLHILKRYRPVFTGEGIFLERCAAQMQTMAPEVGHDLLVTATPAPGRQPAVHSTLGNVFYLNRHVRPAWRHELALVWWFVRHLHRYDVVHVRTHADWYFLSYALTRLLGRRLVLSATLDDSVPALIHGYRPALRPVARRLFGLFGTFVSISPRLHRQTSSVMNPARCQLVPCGIVLPDPSRDRALRTRSRLGIGPDAMVLIFVGGLCERKDPRMLIRLLPQVLAARPDSYLLIVGPSLEPEYVEGLVSLTRSLGLAERVIFVGEVADANPYFEAADIMTFGSHLEGFGTVVPEAQANGLPVVVRHLPGVNDLFIKPGETGFVFTDDQGYLDAVLRLIADPDLRRRVGETARAFVCAHFSIASVARRYLDIYGFPVTAAAGLPLGMPDEIGRTERLPGAERPIPELDRHARA